PTGTLGAGPHTALVLREAKLGPVGPTFRGVRFDQGGALSLGERTVLSYGGEYVLVGLGAAASSLRPRAELNVRITDDWSTAFVFASTGFAYDGGSSSSWGTRLAFREKLDGDLELTAVYSFGGALAPSDDADGLLRDSLRTAQRHSLGAGISAKVPHIGTKVQAGY